MGFLVSVLERGRPRRVVIASKSPAAVGFSFSVFFCWEDVLSCFPLCLMKWK